MADLNNKRVQYAYERAYTANMHAAHAAHCQGIAFPYQVEGRSQVQNVRNNNMKGGMPKQRPNQHNMVPNKPTNEP